MEPGGSLMYSQKPAIGPYREQYESIAQLISLIFILISSHLLLGRPSGLVHYIFPNVFLISLVRATYPTHLILLPPSL